MFGLVTRRARTFSPTRLGWVPLWGSVPPFGSPERKKRFDGTLSEPEGHERSAHEPQVGPRWGKCSFVSGRGRSRTYDPLYVEQVL